MSAVRVPHLPITVLLVVVALILAVVARRDAASAYWLQKPQSAPAALKSNPRIALASTGQDLLVQVLEGRARSDAVDPVVERARTALRAAPLEAAAMRQLGLASAVLGKPAANSQLMLAERISRRDLPTEAVLTYTAASAGDGKTALIHLDRILTVFPRAEARFFVPLASLLADSEGREQLIAYRKRPWFTSFLATAVERVEDPGEVAALLVEARMPPAQARPFMQRLVGRLVDLDRYDAARKLVVDFGKAPSASLDDFRLTRETTDPAFAPLSWRLADGDAVRASLTDDGVLDVAVTPGKPVVVLERVTRFSAGTYILEQQVSKDEADAELLAKWELHCKQADNVVVAWQQPVPLKSNLVRYRSRLQVPPNCPVQYWRLNALADGVQYDARFRIASITLRRDRQ